MDSFFKTVLITLVTVMGLCACAHDPVPSANVPEILSVDCTYMTDCSAVLKAKIANLPVLGDCVFRYGKDIELPDESSLTAYATMFDVGVVSADIEGLSSSTTYYYQACLKRGEQTISSEVKSFTTMKSSSVLPDSPEDVALEAVDLGLSIRWANLNLGAMRPESSGFLYAWGETEAKSSFSWEKYRFYETADRVSKYCIDEAQGKVDYTIFLEPEDDAASIGINSKWRVPTKEEWDELRENCDWVWTDNYQGTGMPGYIVSGKDAFSENSIFLPEAKNSLGMPYGMYWSSTLDKSSSLRAQCYSFSGSRFSELRSSGLSIRPVFGESRLPPIESISFWAPETNIITFMEGNQDVVSYFTILGVTPAKVRDREIVIRSSSPEVATVELYDNPYTDSDDHVYVTIYPHAYGTTEITATTVDGGLEAVHKVVVVRPDVEMLDGDKVYIIVDEGTVDLGLSVEWSSYNLGADSHKLQGNLYMWGHITPVNVPDSSNVNCFNHFGNYIGNGNNTWLSYKHCEGSATTLTKYNTSPLNGKVDGLRVLLPEDDAATAALGKEWRIATFAEWEELRTECSWTFVKNYNRTLSNAWKVTSKVPGYEGRYIVLPAVRHWTSELGDGSPQGAINYCWSLAEEGVYFHGRESLVRVESAAIRPVRDF